MSKTIAVILTIAVLLAGCGYPKGEQYPEHNNKRTMTEEKREELISQYGLEEWSLEDGTIVTIEDFGFLMEDLQRAQVYRSTPEGKILYAYKYPSFDAYLNEAFSDEEREAYFQKEKDFYEWNTARNKALKEKITKEMENGQ